MIQLDPSLLATRLEARYGLGLSGGMQEVEGGKFAAIRPNDLKRPNGFAIIIARTPRIVEASLQLDGFTRSLLRQMSDADDLQRSTFATLAGRAAADGFRIGVTVNGNYICNLAKLPCGEWLKLEVECDRRLQSGKVNEKDLHHCALEVASICLGLVLSLLPMEEIADSALGVELGFPEGAKVRVEVNRYERSAVNRAACIAHYGTKCQACDFEFGEKYGVLGNEYIEVHHRVPVSAMGSAYRLDPVKDLVPVCPNCHAMLHRSSPPLTIEELRRIIALQVSIPLPGRTDLCKG